jgi:hypothetical protein
MLKLPAIFAGISLVVFGITFKAPMVIVFGVISILVGAFFLRRDLKS